MGLQVECPECGHRNPEGEAKCRGKLRYGEQKGERCEFSRLTKTSGKIYWIEYREHGKRKRERIGPSKVAAEARLLEVQKSLVEKRHIERDKNASVTLDQLFDWFLNLQEVQGLDSYRRIKSQIKALRRLLNNQQTIRDITISQLERYIQSRFKEDSPSKKGQSIAPKTVKEEINLLRNIFNRALQHEVISKVPVAKYPSIKIDNVRKRVFSEEEFSHLIEISPLWLKRIVIMARGTGMRQNEIIQLEWSDVDLQEGFVRLSASKTKTDEARSIRLLPNVIAMLKEIPRAIHTKKVFLSAKGRPIPYWTGYLNQVWQNTLKEAGIKDACFHDLRHDFVTRAMRSGNASHVVMKQVGHKTDSMLRRYQLVDERDLLELRIDLPVTSPGQKTG